jgi:hypothetical protein
MGLRTAGMEEILVLGCACMGLTIAGMKVNHLLVAPPVALATLNLLLMTALAAAHD